MQNILTSDHSSYHLHTIYRINAVTKHSVYYASGTSIEDNEIDSVAFCVHCGSKLPKTTEITEPITEDGIILEYYVNAAENELYGNKSQAEEMYYKILKFRSDFIPAKNGLDRLKNGIRSMVVIPGSNKSVEKKKKVKDNVMVKFKSVPRITIF